jgi:MinD-like ATPase involved in chromosome partitioning or flagellar assembly
VDVVVCGDKDLIANVHAANNSLVIAGEAVSPAGLIDILDALSPTGVLVQATADWVSNIIPVAQNHKNVYFFMSGRIKKVWLDELAPAGVIVLPQDLNKAISLMRQALEKVSPTAFKYTDTKTEVKVVHNQVGLMTKGCTLFYSSKGGVGKTTTTVNVAAATGMLVRDIQDKTGQEFRVAVIDNNPDGNLKYQLGYPPLSDTGYPKSIVGFRHLHENSSLNDVIEALNYHEESNVYFVTSPETSQEKLANSPDIFDLCLYLVKRYFHFVFIDMSVHLNHDETIAAINAATDIMVVSNLDSTTVGLLKDRMTEMNQIFGGFSRARLVINNDKKEGDINLRTVVKELSLPLNIELSYCTNIKQGIKKGVPVATLYPSEKYSEQVRLLAQKIIGTSLGDAGQAYKNKPDAPAGKIKNLMLNLKYFLRRTHNRKPGMSFVRKIKIHFDLTYIAGLIITLSATLITLHYNKILHIPFIESAVHELQKLINSVS